MAKIIQFSVPAAEKLGLQRARRGKSRDVKPGQLDLFSGARVVRLHQLSPFEEALLLDDRGDIEAAQAGYYKAIEQEDSAADAWCNLGIIESRAGNYAKAIDCFTQALKLNPRHSEAHYNLANLYAEVGNTNLAKIHYGIAIEIEPDFPNSYYNLGLTLAVEHNYKEAITFLKKYRELTAEEDHHFTDDLISKLSTTLE